MKTIFFFALLFSLPAVAAVSPVLNSACEKGRHDYEVSFEFDRNVQVENLTIKRQKQDYVQNLSGLQGSSIRVDVAKQGGIQGYVVEYRNKENGEFSAYEAALTCQDKEENLSLLKKSKAERLTGNLLDLDQEEVYDEDLALEF